MSGIKLSMKSGINRKLGMLGLIPKDKVSYCGGLMCPPPQHCVPARGHTQRWRLLMQKAAAAENGNLHALTSAAFHDCNSPE